MQTKKTNELSSLYVLRLYVEKDTVSNGKRFIFQKQGVACVKVGRRGRISLSLWLQQFAVNNLFPSVIREYPTGVHVLCHLDQFMKEGEFFSPNNPLNSPLFKNYSFFKLKYVRTSINYCPAPQRKTEYWLWLLIQQKTEDWVNFFFLFCAAKSSAHRAAVLPCKYSQLSTRKQTL